MFRMKPIWLSLAFFAASVLGSPGWPIAAAEGREAPGRADGGAAADSAIAPGLAQSPSRGGEAERDGPRMERDAAPAILEGLERRGPPAPPDVDRAVAAALLARSVELERQGDLEGAKELAVEAIEREPRGPHAEDALGHLRSLNGQLGYDDPHHGLVDEPADRGRAGGPGPEPVPGSDRRAQLGLAAFGAAYGTTLGLALGGPQSRDGSVRGGAVVLGLLGGGGAGALGYYASERFDLTGPQVGTIGAAGTFGAMAGGFVGDLVAGIDDGSPNQITASMAVGGLLGTGAGAVYAVRRPPSAESVHLTSSLAAYGTAAALFLGVAMDPPTREAYSLNAALGGAAGLGAGVWLGELGRAPPRAQMHRADIGAGAAVAGTWVLLYPATGSARATGAISVLSLAGGALAGFYTGRDEAGEPAADGEAAALSAAPPALWVRGAHGEWSRGVPIVRPLRAADHGDGDFSLGFDVASGRF